MLALKEEAFEVAREVVKDFPQDADAMALMAGVCNDYRRTAEAVTWWQKCLECDPRHANAYHGLATVALNKGENERAADLWLKAQKAAPELPGVYRGRAAALLLLGKPQEAVAELEKEAAISPGARENHLLFGQAYLQLKEYEKAVRHYQTALDIRPGAAACYGLATAYARLGQEDKAAEARERFQKLEATEDRLFGMRDRAAFDRSVAVTFLTRAHAGAGQVYYAHGRLKRAEQHARRVAALDPKNVGARQNLVRLSMRNGRLTEALQTCRELQKLDPDDPLNHLNAGFLLGRLRQFDAAEKAVWKGIRLAPKHPEGYRALVQVLLMANRKLPQAAAAARKLVELAPTAPNLALLGDVCIRTGDADGARAALKRASELEPANPTYKRAYERLQPGD